MQPDERELRVMSVLALFQLTEMMLKVYIGVSYAVIRNKLAGAIPFDFRYKQIENMPLERLLAIFRRLNGDKELQARLGKLVRERNEIAHKALLYRFPEVTELFGMDVVKHSENLTVVEDELNDCGVLLANQTSELMAAYHASNG